MILRSTEPTEYHAFSTDMNQGTHAEGIRDYNTLDLIMPEQELSNEASLERLRITENLPYDPLMAMIEEMVAKGRATERWIQATPNFMRNEKETYVFEDHKAGGTM